MITNSCTGNILEQFFSWLLCYEVLGIFLSDSLCAIITVNPAKFAVRRMLLMHGRCHVFDGVIYTVARSDVYARFC